jgi:hypothetical protein
MTARRRCGVEQGSGAAAKLAFARRRRSLLAFAALSMNERLRASWIALSGRVNFH